MPGSNYLSLNIQQDPWIFVFIQTIEMKVVLCLGTCSSLKIRRTIRSKFLFRESLISLPWHVFDNRKNLVVEQTFTIKDVRKQSLLKEVIMIKLKTCCKVLGLNPSNTFCCGYRTKLA